MSSDQNLSNSPSNDQVSKLVIDAIKSLKKTGGSSSEAILQYIRSHESSNIDAIEIERCLNMSLAKKIVRSRTNKKSGIKFYKISAQIPLSTEEIQMETKVQENFKSGKKHRKRNLKAKKNVNCAKKFEENAEGSNNAENKESASQKKNLFCEMCKVSLSSEKNLKAHEDGKKHQNALKRKMAKEQKKNINSSTEKRDINDVHSSSVPTDIQCPNPSETNFDVSDRKKSHSHDYKDSYSNPSNNYYSPNHKKSYPPNSREPYSSNHRESYNHRRNYEYRNYHWNRWPSNQPFRNGSDKRFQSYNHYNRYDQNYHFNQSPHMEMEHSLMHNNWAGMPNPENNEFFSENIQSENIQPVEGETHSTDSNFNEIINTSTNDHKSPVKKSEKKAKRSPGIPIKVITKTAVVIEDIQNQLESEKHQEKGVVLSENMTGKRLAHWINPSNQKDQAEIRRLVTEFSKSKKKENLIKLKLHTDKVPVNSDSNQSIIEETNNVSSLPITPELPESMNSPQPPFETVPIVSSNSLSSISTENKKRRHSSSLTDIALNTTLPVTPLPAARTRSESLTLNENTKMLQGIGTKRKADVPCELSFSRKRKDSVDQGSNSKKHRCSSAECLEKCIESAIANTDALKNSERLEYIESTSLNMNEASKECSSQEEAVYIKKEIVDETDTTQMTSLSLNELIQKQTDVIASCQDDASMTPVESLINLFATGNITIKKEFDDPLIDAIRSIDPVLLDKVCEDQSISVKNAPSQGITEKVIEPVLPSPAISDSSLTLSLKNILNELQIISEEEEKVKSNLLNADQQIQYFQSLLDEWKTKKIKFQSEEEILRNKRNTLVRTMNDLVVQQSAECRSTVESPRPEERPSSNSPQNVNVLSNTVGLFNNEIDAIKINDTENDSFTSIQQETITENSVKIDDEDVIPLESDEVVILPLPENRIPVIDLDLTASPEKNDTDDISIAEPSTDCISANCLKIRDLVAHNAHINSIQIFGDYLYTCASDKSAKRFHLKDPTQVVTYKHAEKNIYHLFVEKMQGKTYVFTCGLNSNFISVFDAATALKVKVHQFRPNVASMCKGRYKIYVGFRNGAIATCNYKDHKELVNIEEPIRSIATTHQGGVNILVALSTKGHVSIRDADRNGLLIKYIKALTHVPLFMSIYNDWVYLSSAGYLSVLDLSSGKFVKKYELPAAYTSLTVYKDHIFTTSFSGFVRCYSKNDIQDVKAYYGAGKMALTCIYAHDGWIFTGNRTGEISVFKFDPETSLPCQFGTCQMVFSRIDDLMYHVLQGKDHNLISMKTCLWQKCKATIRKSWDQEAIHSHIRAHITASYPYLHEPKYNLTV